MKSLTTDEIASFKENGFVVVRNVFVPHDIAELSKACEELEVLARPFREDMFVGVTYFNLHRDCDPFDPNISNFTSLAGVLRRVTYPYGVSTILDRYRTHPSLLGIVSSLLGPDIVQLVNQVNFNPPGIGKGWGWHQDYRFRKPGLKDSRVNYVQVLTAVDACHPGNGGLRLVPQSDRLGGLALDKDVANAESRFDASIAVTPTLSPGDAVMFNPYVIHGSTPNLSSTIRRVYINGYARATGCDYGKPVLAKGAIIQSASEPMEYEHDQAIIKKASKY